MARTYTGTSIELATADTCSAVISLLVSVPSVSTMTALRAAVLAARYRATTVQGERYVRGLVQRAKFQ